MFRVDTTGSRALREPLDAERALVSAARWICPTDAVRFTHDEAVNANHDTLHDAEHASLFHELATSAERVRWTLDAIPWSEIESARAPASLRAVVREMAFSEHATYSATQCFMESFFEDVDISQWISVWFYEETKHPHVLIEWLRRLGEPTPLEFVLKGRVSTPFMRSIVGTLVTNVISEVTAAQAYRHLARTSPEPVLARIARLISGDEARHAASFLRFARKRLAMETPEGARRERARGLEVLQAWLGGARQATHPVAEMIERLEGNDVDHGGRASLDLDFAAVRTRVVHVVGLLLDVPLRREHDVALVLRDLLAKGRTS